MAHKAEIWVKGTPHPVTPTHQHRCLAQGKESRERKDREARNGGSALTRWSMVTDEGRQKPQRTEPKAGSSGASQGRRCTGNRVCRPSTYRFSCCRRHHHHHRELRPPAPWSHCLRFLPRPRPPPRADT